MTILGNIINNFDNQIVRLSQNREDLEPFIIEGKNGTSQKRLFTRDRVLSLRTLIYFLITPRSASLSVELEEFFNSHDCSVPTKSAISQRRRNISHNVFIYLNNSLLDDYYSHSNITKRWKGLYILAVDGTTITMPRGARFEKLFGYATVNHTERKIPTARVVYIVDALNHTIVAAVIGRFDEDEASLAWEAIKLLPDYLIGNSILLMDRLYPSHVLFSALTDKGIQYVMRARRNFNPKIDEFFDSKNTEEDFLIRPSQGLNNTKIRNRMTSWGLDKSILKPTSLHLTKSKLPNGGTEVIINNVWSVHISAAQAYNLYGRRWGVEVVIGQEKNEEQVEIFSGFSKECILQDFFAKIITHNIAQISANETNRLARAKKVGKNMKARNTKKKDTKQAQTKPNVTKDNRMRPPTKGRPYSTKKIIDEQINMNIGLYLVKKFLLNFYLSKSKRVRNRYIRELGLEMAKHRFVVVPGRHFPRVFISYKTKGKYYTVTNYGRAI